MLKKLKETMNEHFFQNYGVFTAMASYTSKPTWLDVDTAHHLDLEYYLNHSGEKYISPLFRKLLNAEEQGAISGTLNILSSLIINKYEDKWNRIHDAFLWSTYDPVTTHDTTKTETRDLHTVKTPDITTTDHSTEATKIVTTNNNTDNENTFGFNSDTAVPSGKTISDGTETTQGSPDDNITHAVVTKSGTEHNDDTGTVTTHDVGYLDRAPQDLIQKEIDLRKDFNLWEEMFKDTDTFLTLSVY